MAAIAINKINIMWHGLSLKIIDNINVNHIPKSEPSAEYPVVSTIISQIPNPISASFQLINITTPQVVAIPFPPLKLKNGEKQWPITDNKPIIVICHDNKLTIDEIYTGTKPFPISKINMTIPQKGPSVRKALAKPGFPEPKSLISIFLNIFPIHTPKGIEPQKNANTAIKMNFPISTNNHLFFKDLILLILLY